MGSEYESECADCLPTPPAKSRKGNTGDRSHPSSSTSDHYNFKLPSPNSSTFTSSSIVTSASVLPTPRRKQGLSFDAAIKINDEDFSQSYAQSSTSSEKEVEEEDNDDFHVEQPEQGHAGRGRHTRTAQMGKRLKWREHVQNHMELLMSGKLLGLNNNKCTRACERQQACIEYVDIRLAKTCAQQSFGDAVFIQDWANITPNHQAVNKWFQLVHQCRVLDTVHSKVTRIDYKINGVRVCQGAWAWIHGVRPATSNGIHRQVMRGFHSWNNSLNKEAALTKRSELADLSNAAAAWWHIRLGYYEMLVEHGKIMHPRLCWVSVYEEEFLPEMAKIGLTWRPPTHKLRLAKSNLKSGGEMDQQGDDQNDQGDDEVVDADENDVDNAKGSISSWYRGRSMALQKWAHEQLGPDAPPFKLVSRAKHSAYVRHEFTLFRKASYADN